jgi:SAM-dependent methyltransferase
VQTEEYARLYEHEDRYWWFVGRRRLALRLLGRFSQVETPKILDVGCGTGAVLDQLRTLGIAVGLDRFQLALDFCAKRGIEDLALGDGEALPFQTDVFDAAIALDIFEHVEGDFAAVSETFRSLKPGGLLVLSVPAYRWLWGPHDIALMHKRRYTLRQMKSMLERAGFDVEKCSYSVFFLFPLVVLVRLLDKLRRRPAQVSLPNVPNWLNSFLLWVQDLEASIILHLSLPWGSSVVAVARKPAG